MAGHSSSLASVQVAQMKTKLLVARSITHLTLGAALWLFAPRAAQVLADGLQNPAEEIES